MPPPDTITANWLTPDSPLSPGRWTTSRHHRRVELTEQEIGLRVRCHDCGAIARENWDKHRARFDADGWNVVPERDPTPWALDRLDHGPCEPLGQGDLLDLIGSTP